MADLRDTIDLPRDDAGRIIGYAVGKEANLREWLHRKQQREDEALFARLRARKRAREVRAEGGKRLERMRASGARWQAKNRERVNEKTRRHRAKRYRANVVVHACRECGAEWCKVPWVRNHRKDFCSRNCKLRWQRYRAKGLR